MNTLDSWKTYNAKKKDQEKNQKKNPKFFPKSYKRQKNKFQR